METTTNGASEDQLTRRWYVNNYRQAAVRGGAAYSLARDPNGRWGVFCHLPDGTQRPLGIYEDFETGLRVQDYCVNRDTLAKLALIELWENGNPDPIEKLLEDAQAFGELPRRRVRLTLEVDVDMRGTDDEIGIYIRQHIRTSPRVRAARVVTFEGPRIEEPRPEVSDV